jgi:uncharacterized protein YndB with AHSA1/START domain
MLMYEHEERRTVQATPEEVFALLSYFATHPALAGSGEVQGVRLITDGPLGVGTAWEADEQVRFGKGQQEFVARSELTAFEPPRRIAWTSTPPGHPKPKRIEWTYELTPTATGATEVVERVEVDMGALNRLMRRMYENKRGHYVAEGMRQTLDNIEARTRG